jgi:hypothetical protein
MSPYFLSLRPFSADADGGAADVTYGVVLVLVPVPVGRGGVVTLGGVVVVVVVFPGGGGGGVVC